MEQPAAKPEAEESSGLLSSTLSPFFLTLFLLGDPTERGIQVGPAPDLSQYDGDRDDQD